MENYKPSLSEEATFLLRALGQFNLPVAATKFEKSLPKLSPVKRSEVRLLLDSLAKQGLVKIDRQSNKVTYWLPALEERLAEQLITLLQDGPLAPSGLGGRNSPIGSLPPGGRKSLLKRLINERRIFEFPAAKGTGNRLSVNPPEIQDYLQVMMEAFFAKLRPLSMAFEEAGVYSKEDFYIQVHQIWLNSLPLKISATPEPVKVPAGEVAERLILEGMMQLDSAAIKGALVSLTRLRHLLRVHFPAKVDFDRAILKFAEQERIALHRHVHVSTLSQAERDDLVTDGRDNYFIGIALRV